MLYPRGIVMYHPDNAQDTDDSAVVCRPELPLISSRWAPGSVLRRDTAAGTFEHVNPRDFSNDALYLQQALLYHESARPRRVSWFGLLLPLALLACGAFWYGVTP